MSTITYGQFTLDLAQVPETSLLALVSSGLSHKMGNEVASKLAAFVKAQDAAGTPVSDEAKAEAKAGFQSEMFSRIMAGTIGVSTRAPAGPKPDTIKAQVTLKSLTAHLKAHGLAVPSGEKTLVLGGKEYNRAALVEAHYTKHQERLDNEISAERKRREKEAKKLADVQGEVV